MADEECSLTSRLASCPRFGARSYWVPVSSHDPSQIERTKAVRDTVRIIRGQPVSILSSEVALANASSAKLPSQRAGNTVCSSVLGGAGEARGCDLRVREGDRLRSFGWLTAACSGQRSSFTAQSVRDVPKGPRRMVS